jgi:hypothetical protein
MRAAALVVTVAATCVALLAGCGASRLHAGEAVRLAMKSRVGKGLATFPFPQKPGVLACVVHGGGPPPGVSFPGECRTSVTSLEGGITIVRFRALWHESASRDGRFVWEFRVSPKRQIVGHREWGNSRPWEWA